MNWFGLKPVIAAVIATRPVNYVFRLIADRFLSGSTAARFPLSVPKVRYRLAHGPDVLLLEPTRDEVARTIYWGEGRCLSAADQYALDCVEWLCRDARTFIDIGAYSGLFALVAARSQPALKAIAFEIVPENYLLVVRNIIENDLVGRVEARLCGLSDKAGSMTMAPALNLERLASSMSIGSVFASGVRIPIAALDDAIEAGDGPFVLKIDVEGFEANVFRGGHAFLVAHKPDVICEILSRSKDYPEIEEMLSPLGYRFFLFTDDGLKHCERIDPTLGGRDWLFTARSDFSADSIRNTEIMTR